MLMTEFQFYNQLDRGAKGKKKPFQGVYKLNSDQLVDMHHTRN